LESIIKQEFQPAQIVVSDDSASEYASQVQKLCDSKKSVGIEYVVHIGSNGVSANSNHGMSFLSTDFVHCLHQDDFIRNADCYRRVVSLLKRNRNSWVLLGGIASGTRIIPKLREGKLPREINLGINTIGGPSAAIFPNDQSIKFSDKFSMLCDVDLFLKLQDAIGSPALIESNEIEYQMGGWQLQRRISNSDLLKELIDLNSYRENELRSSLWQVFKYGNRRDVKLRALKVMSQVTQNNRWKVSSKLFSSYVKFRYVIRKILKWKSVHGEAKSS
jgi:glycosyltransferase involved in cell wall biosynthesis